MLRGASSYGSSLPYYGGGSYPYGSNGISNCYDTCNWEAGMMGSKSLPQMHQFFKTKDK